MCKSTIILLLIHLIALGTCTYVDKNWLEGLLVKDDKLYDVKEVLSFVTSPAVKNVTVLGSEDTRITMEVLLENGLKTRRSVILKSLPSTPALREQIAKSGLFNVEINTYKNALSKMEQQLYKLNDKSEPLWVRAFGFKEFEDLLLEDVVGELGYNIANRWIGFHKDQSLLAMKGLAKFHALSAVTNQENNNMMEQQFSQSLLERNYEALNDFYEVVYNNFAKVIEDTWGPEWAPAAKKVRDVAPNVKERLLKLYQNRDSFLNTLNLGAPTISNIFFKYDVSDLYKSVKPIAVRFGYFQLTFFNSPLHDVQYMLNTSPNIVPMTKNRDDFLLTYYNALVYYLGKFGYKGKLPTKEEFLNEVKRTNFEGITVAIQILPVRFEPPTGVDSERYAEENKNSNTSVLAPFGMYSNEYTVYMKDLLKKALDDNVL